MLFLGRILLKIKIYLLTLLLLVLVSIIKEYSNSSIIDGYVIGLEINNSYTIVINNRVLIPYLRQFGKYDLNYISLNIISFLLNFFIEK